MYEHRHEPLLSRKRFALRIARHTLVAFGIIAVALGVGMLGYRCTEGLRWVDAFFNAAMIFTGEGPSGPPVTNAGKIFVAIYGLASVIVMLSSVAILLAPAIHRGIHKFNLDASAIARKK